MSGDSSGGGSAPKPPPAPPIKPDPSLVQMVVKGGKKPSERR